MALASATIFELEQAGGDTLNGGGFDPSQTLTADLSTTTNTANTSAPVVYSSSYSFVPGDFGAWLFIKSGTHWQPGWYKIVSVASNQATLSAAIGAGMSFNSTAILPTGNTTALGCTSDNTATLSAGTWTIDYSQQVSAAFPLTGLTTAAANAIVLTSSATKAMIGNLVQITGGTNFTTGIYCITAVTAGVSFTVDRNCTSAAGASGTCGIGGAFATPGKVASVCVAGNTVFQQYSSTKYTMGTNTTNVAGGYFNPSVNLTFFSGYNTNRHVSNTDLSMPYNIASGISSCTMFGGASTGCNFRNMIVDGAGLSAITGVNTQNGGCHYHLMLLNCTNSGLKSGVGSNESAACILAIGCTTATAIIASGGIRDSAAIDCTGVNGFQIGGAADGLITRGCAIGVYVSASNSVNRVSSYNNSSDGIRGYNGNTGQITNSISYGNAGQGISAAGRNYWQAINCATGGNTTNPQIDPTVTTQQSCVALSGNPWTNPTISTTGLTIEALWAAFALNNTAGAGAPCRASGTVPYGDLGAVQHQDSGGGSGGASIFGSAVIKGLGAL